MPATGSKQHRDRILVSIGVAQPEELDELPGVLLAAERMAAWGEQNGYRSVHIHDGPIGKKDNPVTLERIRGEVTAAIKAVHEHSELSRLIIFFAGHGSAIDRRDQYWLLSNWWTDSNEAIKVSGLQRILEFYGPRQVSIIADACQELDAKFMDVIGSAVLLRPKPEEDPEQYELDRFLAADAGLKSFMVKATDDTEAYCLFTEVLLDALEGDAKSAFVNTDKGSCVTSESLYTYLKTEVPLAAGRLNLAMIPRPYPGFLTDKVYLERSSLTALGGGGNKGFAGELRRSRAAPAVELERAGGPRDTDRIEAEKDERDERRRGMLEEAGDAPLPDSFESGCGIALWGIPAVNVSASGARVEPNPHEPEHWHRLWLDTFVDGETWADVVVDLIDGRSAYVCGVAGFISALHVYSEVEAGLLHYRVGRGPPGPEALDLLAKANAGLLDEASLISAAARIRLMKHEILTIGCISAQFYDAVRDVESIRRVASYYCVHRQIVPIDVALLSGGRIHAEGGKLFVDIAPTKRREPRTADERGLPFTYSETKGWQRAPVGGRAPWMRAGWGAVETANYDASAHQWRDAALAVLPHLAPGPFSMVKPDGRDALAALVGITDRSTETQYATAGM
ncbi:caspase family protein [Sphingopyxis sp. H115]|uniref:caspase family protein n=1 Tax=Sphingopyxis sp. H115 TaxID=1759073 RepID=UPI000736F4B7|nr:caspase family protein [Sphingopyxis sp. H115]KTE15578.1 hypothetical protein ATE71_07500 [Sphingopyxis sp. H115]